MLARLSASPARRWLFRVFLTSLFLLALCTLPYPVPLRPSFSLSWAFGYNNRAGIALVLLAACAVGWFGSEMRPRILPGKPLTRSTLGKVLLLTLALAAVLHLLYGRYDGVSEGVYTVDHVKLILAGQRPYRDFSFAYGALCLYAPVALVHLFGMRVTSACDLFWGFVILCGTLELYLVLRWTEFSPAAQRRVFLLLSALTLCRTATTSPRWT